MKILISLVLLTITSNILASDGSSGCGPGWYLFKKNTLVSSSLRVTTNAVLFPITTIGMTIGTSNCSQHSLVKNEKKSLHFVINNYYEVKSEIAKGGGEFLSALTHTLGCTSDATAQLSSELRKNYGKMFNKNSVKPDKVLLEIYNTIFTNSSLTHQCTLKLG